MALLRRLLWWIAEKLGFGRPTVRVRGVDGQLYDVRVDQVSWYIYFIRTRDGQDCVDGFILTPGVQVRSGCWGGTARPDRVLRANAA